MIQSLSILIPTHNRAALLERTLRSLQSLRVPAGRRVELLVIANVCSDDTAAVVDRASAELAFAARCVEEPKIGLNMARTRGVTEAAGEVLAFLDDDVWVEPDWLEGLLEVYDRHNADMTGGRVLLWWDAVQPPAWAFAGLEVFLSGLDLGEHEQRLTLPVAVGANFSAHRRVFEKVGMFRPGLDRTGRSLLCGGETEFLQRGLAAGFSLYYAPHATVKHWVAPERIGFKYLHRLAFEFGRSSVFMQQPRAARLAALAAAMPARAGVNLIGSAVARLGGDRPLAVERRLAFFKRIGIAAAALQRLAGHRPGGARAANGN